MGLASVRTSTYVAIYAREISIFSATLGITLSNNVSQRRASGHRDMTPSDTGTRRVLVDHDCCTAAGVAYAATKHKDRTEAMPFENMIADVERDYRFRLLRHLRHDTCPGDTEKCFQ